MLCRLQQYFYLKVKVTNQKGIYNKRMSRICVKMIKINRVPVTKLYTSWQDSLDYLEDTERLRRIPLNLQLLREPYKRKKNKKNKKSIN